MLQMNLFAGQEYSWEVKNRRENAVGEGEGGTNLEVRIDVYILPSVS